MPYMDTNGKQRDLSPPQVAALIGVNAGKVGTWINSGELQAYDISNGTRPRWRITREALGDFRRRRGNTARHLTTRPMGTPRPRLGGIEQIV